MPKTRSTRRSRLPRLRLLPYRRASRVIHATIDLLASVSMQDGSLERREVDLLLDLLHGSFPDEDRSWMTLRLTRALGNPQSLESLGATLRQKLNREQRNALALQCYVLLQANADSAWHRAEAFGRLCEVLDITETAAEIHREMALPTGGDHLLEWLEPTPKLPFSKLVFAAETQLGREMPSRYISLPEFAKDSAFIAYQAATDVWIRNVGREPLIVRGLAVDPNAFVRIIDSQSIVVPGWQLAHADILEFFRVLGASARTVHIGVDDGKLVVTRNRNKHSHVRVALGLRARLQGVDGAPPTQLRPSESLEDGLVDIATDHETIASYEGELILSDGRSISLEKLRRESMQAGSSFQLRLDRKQCLISNNPNGLGSDDILLSRGLSDPVTLRILFSPERQNGLLEIIEAEQPITVDGQPVRHSSSLDDGALIRLSPSQAIRCRFSEGLLDEEHTMVRSLELVDLGHRFSGGNQAFDGVSMRLSRGELVGIIGPSGCGKSSLLTAISGHLKPSRGQVLINGEKLYSRRESMLPFIGHLPQEEALSSQLTVREHLRHSLMIRRPQLSLAEQGRRVDALVSELGLEHRADERVGSSFEKHLSGGERGRLDLGLDFGSTAEILLIDEPTSGLSSKDSERIIQHMRELARDKIIICSLHTPGARVLQQLDKILLLDQGGRPAFFGTPAAMVSYFLNAARELELPTRNRPTSQLGADFVFDVLEAPLILPSVGMRGSRRRFSPEFWQERFLGHQVLDEVSHSHAPELEQVAAHKTPPPPQRRMRAILAVLAVHLERAFLGKFRSRGTIYGIILEAPLLAGLIAWTLRASPQTAYEFGTALNIPIFLFLAVTVAMFLGLTNSATEILRDGALIRRERNCRPVISLYVGAKFAAVLALAALQNTTFLVVAHLILEIQGMFWHHWAWMTLTAGVGSALALLISALVKSERAALSAVPLLLVPQMLLAGALVPFKEMNRGLFQGGGKARDNGAEPVPARVMPLRYAFEGILVTQARANPYAAYRHRVQVNIDQLKERETLSDEERGRLRHLQDLLLRLQVAEVSSARSAWKLLEKFEGAFDSPKRLAEITIMQGGGDDFAPFGEFFASERVDLLTSAAEIHRKDYRRDNTTDHDVFLAYEKYWHGHAISTRRAAALVLSVTCAVVLFLTVIAVRWRYRVRL